jgi:hypothetical protein
MRCSARLEKSFHQCRSELRYPLKRPGLSNLVIAVARVPRWRNFIEAAHRVGALRQHVEQEQGHKSGRFQTAAVIVRKLSFERPCAVPYHAAREVARGRVNQCGARERNCSDYVQGPLMGGVSWSRIFIVNARKTRISP